MKRFESTVNEVGQHFEKKTWKEKCTGCSLWDLLHSRHYFERKACFLSAFHDIYFHSLIKEVTKPTKHNFFRYRKFDARRIFGKSYSTSIMWESTPLICRRVCVCIYEYMWSSKANQACIRHGIFVLLQEDIRTLSLEVLQKRLNWVCEKKKTSINA